MNPTIKERWTKALRSGDYRQGEGYLRRPSTDTESGKDEFCCLGVLCELAVEDGVVERRDPDFDPKAASGWREYQYAEEGTSSQLGSTAILPGAVQRWAGVSSHGNYTAPYEPEDGSEPEPGEFTLTHDNDSGKKFPEIADLIEKYL